MLGNWLDKEIVALAARQAGGFTAKQLVVLGANYDQLRRRERSGVVRRVRHGLYVHSAFGGSWQQRLWLEVLAAGDGSAVSGPAAEALHGFWRSKPGAIEVQTSEGGNHRPLFGIIHETFWMPPSHLV